LPAIDIRAQDAGHNRGRGIALIMTGFF